MTSKENSNGRVFYLTDYVESSKLRPIIEGIVKLLKEDDENEDKLKEFERKPIEVHIDSYGGNCYDGLTLANLLNESKSPIHTFCYGKAMSMGLYLFMQGDIRTIHEDGFLMYHQLSGAAWGKFSDIIIDVDQKERLHNLLTKRISGKLSKKGKKLVKRSNKLSNDLYLSGKEAKKYNFATDIIMYNEGETK